MRPRGTGVVATVGRTARPSVRSTVRPTARRTVRRAVRRTVARWLALAALAASPACTPLYLPPVPQQLPTLETRLRLRDVRVDRLGGQPGLAFVAAEVPTPGWAAVQWFPPSGGEVASASVWLDDASLGRVTRVPFPDDVARERPGRWRAVLSFGDRIVRQLEWDEPAGP